MLNFELKKPYYEKVTLIGMMGTGKSKFGRQIANILKFNFYDVDHIIEKDSNEVKPIEIVKADKNDLDSVKNIEDQDKSIEGDKK